MSTKHKILVVDDEIGHLRLLEKIILDLGFKVITAIDGLDGLEKLKDNQPISVILSDHNMPNIEGNAFLSMAKGISPRSQRIMITALRDPEMMEKSINKGEVFRFLHKVVYSSSLILFVCLIHRYDFPAVLSFQFEDFDTLLISDFL